MRNCPIKLLYLNEMNISIQLTRGATTGLRFSTVWITKLNMLNQNDAADSMFHLLTWIVSFSLHWNINALIKIVWNQLRKQEVNENNPSKCFQKSAGYFIFKMHLLSSLENFMTSKLLNQFLIWKIQLDDTNTFLERKIFKSKFPQ